MAREATCRTAAKVADSLDSYRAKRDFSKTPEPRGLRQKAGRDLAFVIQKHHASTLHYDFRLELDGAMLSWAVPKGPSLDATVKRMAVRVEDHPISYNDFEGTIPKSQYGAGTVIIWDRGTWEPHGDPRQGLADGKLAFTMNGEKLQGVWELIRIKKRESERQMPWLLFKKHDRYERPTQEYDIVSAQPDRVAGKRPAVNTRASPPKARAGSAKTHAGRLPDSLAPQLATLASRAPAEGEWIYEVKFDGYRLMTRIEKGKPVLLTRSGQDWSAKMPMLVEAVSALGIDDAWLDGEIVVMNPHGVPSFSALQNAFDSARTSSIQYFLFDAPFLNGEDLRREPLVERRRRLQALLDERGSDVVRFSADFESDANSVLQSACRMKLEGVMAKRADSIYESRRSRSWLKLKCTHRQEFVVGGFTDRKGSVGGTEIGSLLLGVHEANGALRFVGSVGTGWSRKLAAELKIRLLEIEAKASPFAGTTVPRRRYRRPEAQERWVEPSLVAEVSFAGWTADEQLRHASFQGLRSDKAAKAITLEKAIVPSMVKAATGRSKSKPGATAATTRVTHADRVIDPSSGLTKLELVRYYESIADWLLPYLKGRPCSLVRAPTGIDGEIFFQKHLDKLKIAGVKELPEALSPEHEPMIEVSTAEAIASCAQMNVVEFHVWSSRVRSIARPDQVVFDLDPGEGVSWPKVREGAMLTRSLLQQLGLVSWIKTSGGKGLHLIVPIAPRHDWKAVRGFARALVAHLAQVIPDRFVAKAGPSNRIGKIFVDYLRNGEGATTASAYSARARHGLGVSMPIAWDELDDVKSSDQWTIANARDHVSFRKIDPWAALAACKQTLTAAIKALGPSEGEVER